MDQARCESGKHANRSRLDRGCREVVRSVELSRRAEWRSEGHSYGHQGGWAERPPPLLVEDILCGGMRFGVKISQLLLLTHGQPITIARAFLAAFREARGVHPFMMKRTAWLGTRTECLVIPRAVMTRGTHEMQISGRWWLDC